jgi:tyrosinase
MRVSAEKMTDQQVADLRAAIAAMAQISDDRGYQYFARLHGGPPRPYCQHGYSDQWDVYHGAPLFLPWHRAYLNFIELAMQDRVAGVTMPWWDWTSPKSHAEGIPASYTGDGNPLAAQPVAQGFSRPRGVPEMSWRDPDIPANLPTADMLDSALAKGTFMDFSTYLEQQLHNNVHGWVGGAMGQVPIAAFDPIFFAHHTMVDRVWRLWQAKYGLAGPPQASFSVVLDPFPVTVGDIVNVSVLGYDYAGSTVTAEGTG